MMAHGRRKFFELADVLARIAGTPQSRLHELLPWNWVPEQRLDQAA